MVLTKTTKRKASGDDRHSTKKKRSSLPAEDLDDGSVFGELVKKAGVRLKAGNVANEIVTDQALFQRDLSTLIKRHAEYPQVVDEMVECISKHVDDPQRFFWSLMPVTTAADADKSSRGGNQDSLIRMMLGVASLQLPVMQLLLEKLAELTGDEEPIVQQGERVNLPRLIMSQFRWLDQIIDSRQVTKKMLEILCIVPLETQREVIACIPEVVDDAEHNDVAKELRDLLVQDNQLAVPILDALSNLTLKPDLLAEVRTSVIQSLASVNVDDMPVIVRFLQQTISSTEAYQVISDLRANLDFQSYFPPESSSTPNSSRTVRHRNISNPDAARGSEALTIDAIRSGIRFQKSLADAWIKAIDSVRAASDHKVVDMFALLILHANNYRKPVEALMRNKIRAGHFSEVLVQATFGSHAQVLREYFPSTLNLAECLLRSPEPIISHFASTIYGHAFAAFDAFCQQEIVGSLVTHIGSGLADEVDSALDILTDLVHKHVKKMSPFTVFVKGVLDYIDNLAVSQIRKLYAALAALAFNKHGDEGSIQDEMYMMIRKQLSNNDIKYKRMGVIGAIMVVRSLSEMSNSLDETAEDADIEESVYQHAINLLGLVRASCMRSPEANALFMDELANIMQRGKVHTKIEVWVSECVINDFQDDFVVDIEPDAKCDMMDMNSQFSLDDDSEGSIAINVIPLLARGCLDKAKSSEKTAKDRAVSLLCLSPHFRLLQICEQRQHDSDLSGIDALLGCPLYLAQDHLVEKIESLSKQEKTMLCTSLFYSINWFREIVNAFATQSDPEMKSKVISRLHNISLLQTSLQICLAATPSYKPPLANFDSEEVKLPSLGNASKSAGTKKAGGKKKKKKDSEKDKENVGDSDEDSRDSSNTQADKTHTETQIDKQKQTNGEKNTVDLQQYRNFFRELDLSVFTILQTGLITKAALDTNMNTKDTVTVQLQPAQLEFLLIDLVRKLVHALPATATKRRTFLKSRDAHCGFWHLDESKPKQVVEKVVALLPAVCQHLEATSAYFQAFVAANDGMVDGPFAVTEEGHLMSSCFHLSLQVVATIFSWSGHLMPDNRPLLTDALNHIASRISDGDRSKLPFQQALKQSFEYVKNFTSTVPSMASAVTLVRLLDVLAEKSDSQGLSEKIGELSGEFLKRPWQGEDGQRAKGAKHNELLQVLLQLHFKHTVDVLGALENISSVGVPELLDAGKEGASDTYPTLTRNSFPVYFRTMLSQLVVSVKVISPSKPTDSTEVKMDRLIQWNLAVRIFHIFVNLIKALDNRTNLGAVLKYGRQFVEVFLRQGMPLLDLMFRHHRADVQSLLKNLQLSTRALHHMCGHSKIIKDISLTNQVPLVKRCLEMFVYRVKAMLTINKCLEAFWLGNLKNRDLQGEEILSQSQASGADNTTQDGDSDQESLPEDDDDSDVEVGDGSPDNSEVQESYSETY